MTPTDGDLQAAAQALRLGQPVVVPTDTVYGVAVLSTNAEAVAELFTRKGRDFDQPLALLVADLEQAKSLTTEGALPSAVQSFWPGPLTVLVPRKPNDGLHLGQAPKVIGLRCPNHPFIQALAALVGPLAVTSANQSGQPTPTEASAAGEALGGDLLVIDGGSCRGLASTLVDCTTSPVTVVRQGEITLAELRSAGLALVDG
ncbi:MAG TPA: threonylcarbamoyl-AMP synthase [Acidimicrobiia bacterium]|jgi:L-threonylcarbamoyladenylate synthase|nr:threonylcarbamoyl-AMP synthase [Acidimicrobiia bacterium]HIL46407.1 threonylcarbamoyl-AMP synthase [Acidimicrobiia bacterium]